MILKKNLKSYTKTLNQLETTQSFFEHSKKTHKLKLSLQIKSYKIKVNYFRGRKQYQLVFLSVLRKPTFIQ